ncbi:cell division protein ZapD [Rheinheimera sp.]|uniref:cell division protein ZapD n=1 Tax=Rheinheimera sp. TaxID=1869214 RepID=UPI00307E9FC3
MAAVLYEHPLNEKVRTYLRVEYLFAQVKQFLPLETQWQQQGFFTALFALIEVLDRNDVRPDLIKDIERCEASLVNWSRHPQISDDALQQVLQKAVRLQSELLRGSKFANCLKEDKFLSPLRQRFFIPGGTCPFDLPQLQYWSEQAHRIRQQQANDWLDQLRLVESAITYVLSFLRERGQFHSLVAENGFMQNNTEQFELLRIQYDSQAGCYPTISGNKYRYAIRFMQLCDALGRTTIDKNVSFELACC